MIRQEKSRHAYCSYLLQYVQPGLIPREDEVGRNRLSSTLLASNFTNLLFKSIDHM